MLPAVGAVTGVLNLSGAAGAPFVGVAAILLQDIVQTCDKVKIYKKQSRQLCNKCTQILNLLDDLSLKMEGAEIQQIADQLTPILEKTLKRMQAYSNYNSVMTFIKNTDIRDGLNLSETELQTGMDLFNIHSNITLNTALRATHNQILQAVNNNKAEMEDLLYRLLTGKAEREQVIELQRSGEHVAEQIMEAGQAELRVLREVNRTEGGLSVQGAASSHSVPAVYDSQRYLQYQRGLINLHRETGIPPSIKVLNGEVVRKGDFAVAGGAYSDIWVGMWLGEEKVALKAMRNIRASDSRAKKRFENEIKMWAELKNIHILPFYGIVTDLGQHIHMVSPWQENGNVLEYIKQHSDADRLLLIYGAAQGLKYLHSENVIHGNGELSDSYIWLKYSAYHWAIVKCANILVTNTGEACICDFGMAKVMEEVTERSASVTLTEGGRSARWLAPELIAGQSPSKEADTYSYAMAILELLTERRPYPDVRRDAAVIHRIMSGEEPARPQGGADMWLSDGLWVLMQRCWQRDILSRPSMAEVTLFLKNM